MTRSTLTLVRPAAALTDPNIGASDTCMDCRSDLADFTNGWQLCEQCRRVRVRILEAQLAPRGSAQPKDIMEQLFDIWTITEYVNWMNGNDDPRVHGGLMNQPEDWAEYDITTVRQLGDYLDACVERERQKDGMA